MIHPRWGMSLGHHWSACHRKRSGPSHRDSLYRFACAFPHPIDYFLFGHLHAPIDLELPNKARLVVLGGWMPHGNYAVFDDQEEIREVKSILLYV
jgi:hypothetical protein